MGFTVAPETVKLMAAIVDDGELEALRPERVWSETEKALATARPRIYLETLRECGALARVFPEVDKLWGVPQPARWHPEIDTGVHTMMALDVCASLTNDVAVRYAVLTHDLGKGETPPSTWPRHHGHGERSAQILGRIADRLPIPKRHQKLAERVARYHGLAHTVAELRPATILKLLASIDALRPSDAPLEGFVLACEADARGRLGLEATPYPQADLLRRARSAALRVGAAAVQDGTLEGPALGEAIERARAAAIGRELADVRRHA
jgi:tRNA nucleotidyltransferase (CCA-adding enzyme)